MSANALSVMPVLFALVFAVLVCSPVCAAVCIAAGGSGGMPVKDEKALSLEEASFPIVTAVNCFSPFLFVMLRKLNIGIR